MEVKRSIENVWDGSDQDALRFWKRFKEEESELGIGHFPPL